LALTVNAGRLNPFAANRANAGAERRLGTPRSQAERIGGEDFMAEALMERVFGGEPNLSWTERGISLVLGLGLAAAGAQPRPNPLLNVAALLGGSYLALRGATGRCPIKAALVEGRSHPQVASRR
jgi:hypothetical protein